MAVGARRHGFLRSTLLLLTLAVVQTDADNTLQIIGKLKTFRDATQALFEATAKSLDEAGLKEDGEKVAKWNTEWLSLLGVNRGLTGLAKDFVLNYLGRSSYHDFNGPLVGAIRDTGNVLMHLPSGKTFDKYDVDPVAQKVLEICKTGMKLFDKEGSMYAMLKELKAILKKDHMIEHFARGLSGNLEVRKAFSYFAGPRPGEGDYDEDLPDDQEL